MTYRRFILALLGSTVMLTAGACSSEQAAKTVEITAQPCAELDIRTSCILETAETTLASIEDPFQWTSSAAELAIAYDANGNSEQAWAHLNKAKDQILAIEDDKTRNNTMSELGLALAKMKRSDQSVDLLNSLDALVATVASADKKTDLMGKMLLARAVHGDPNDALDKARQLPFETESQDAFKGRTIREIAGQFAKAGDFEGAVDALQYITADFTYYSGVARTDIAALAIKANRSDIAVPLLEQAIKIGNDQDNGYFKAGILRDVGCAYALRGEANDAEAYFTQAQAAARQAKSYQEQARSMSRIATKMVDCGMIEPTAAIINESIELAGEEESQIMKNYSFYEIAGAAAFANQADIAQSLVIDLPDSPFGSAVSLKSASERDLAWGQIRHGQTADGLSTANAIVSKREKVHALSRIVRLLNAPKMNALARYL